MRLDIHNTRGTIDDAIWPHPFTGTKIHQRVKVCLLVVEEDADLGESLVCSWTNYSNALFSASVTRRRYEFSHRQLGPEDKKKKSEKL